MSQSTSPRKRRLSAVLVPLETPKRAKSITEHRKDVLATSEVPLSAASDRTFLTARSTPEIDPSAFKTPRPESRTELQDTPVSKKKRRKGKSRPARTLVDISNGIAKTNSIRAPWQLTDSVGGTFLEQDPIFVKDADNLDFLVVATQGEVQLLSVHTSLIERVAQAPEGLSVQAVAPSATASNLVYILYNNGSVYEWNLEDEPTLRLTPPRDLLTTRIASGAPAESKRDEIFSITTKGSQSAIHLEESCIYTTKREIKELQVFVKSGHIVALTSTAIILGRRKGAQAEFTWVELPSTSRITCCAAAEQENTQTSRQNSLSLVYGTSSGQLHLYDDISALFAKNRLPAPRILHWHRGPVASVKFSRDLNYLISGGGETVLVLWQLATGVQQYLPHLSSAIKHISVSSRGDRYAIALDDNSVLVLSTSELKPVANFAGLQLAASATIATPVPAVLDPHDSNRLLLVIPTTRLQRGDSRSNASRPFLQTFDLHSGKHISRQALTRNNLTNFNLGPESTPIVPPDVNKLQISSDGQWLATSDDWSPPVHDVESLVPQKGPVLDSEHAKRRETYLKIWQWDKDLNLWTLTTRFDAPHGQTRALGSSTEELCLVADPKNVGFASLGRDDRIRIWRPKTRLRNGEVVKINGTDAVQWTCRQTIELPLAPRRADSPIEVDEQAATTNDSYLAWSDDGSMIVAAQMSQDPEDAPVIHFVDAVTGSLITKAAVAPEELVAMAFCDKYLIVVGKQYLNLWDIVEDRLSSSIRLDAFYGDKKELSQKPTAMLAVHKTSNSFAICTDAQLEIFSPSQGKSLFRFDFSAKVAGILSSEKGYLVLFTDGTARSVAAHSDGKSIAKLASSSDTNDHADSATLLLESEDKPLSTFATLPEESLVSEATALDLDRNDRPVVQPEQLAEIFDTTQSFAMLSVRDMFHAVVDLYGRKPDRISLS